MRGGRRQGGGVFEAVEDSRWRRERMAKTLPSFEIAGDERTLVFDQEESVSEFEQLLKSEMMNHAARSSGLVQHEVANDTRLEAYRIRLSQDGPQHYACSATAVPVWPTGYVYLQDKCGRLDY